MSYVQAKHRPAVGALWRLDAALGNALAGGGEPMIGRIKLAWWRDALEALDGGKPPAEPVLEALAAHVVPRRLSGAELARMEEGWAVLPSGQALTAADLGNYAEGRGRRLFALTAYLLGAPAEEPLAAAGEAWALVDLARHCTTREDADVALEAARERRVEGRWPSPLRPLGMLAVLAARDADPRRPPWEPRGAPARMLRMLRHRLTGL